MATQHHAGVRVSKVYGLGVTALRVERAWRSVWWVCEQMRSAFFGLPNRTPPRRLGNLPHVEGEPLPESLQVYRAFNRRV